MKQFLARNILLLIICCGANFAYADSYDNTYLVEVIVFEHTHPKRFSNEHWPKFVGQLETAKAFNLNNINSPEGRELAQQEAISLVSTPQLLKNDLNKVRASKGQRLIQYKAWRQPMITGDRATSIYFTDDKEQEVAAIFAIKPMRNNVFSVKVDLIYILQPGERHMVPGVSEIRFTTDTKIKKKEVFYIDHPIIGILIMVSPVVSNN